MKKFFRLIFGRLAIIGAAIILQLLFIAVLVYFLNEKFWVVQILSSLLALIVFFNLMRRDMYPDAKLPWLAFILLVPLFGMIAYCMFSKNSVSRKHKKRLLGFAENGRKIFKESEQKENIPAPYKGQSEYIERAAYLPVSRNSDCEYFLSGEKFWESLKEELRKAEKFIFMEYFIIECGVMWNAILEILLEKVKAGVEVRVIYDDIGSIGKVKANYHKKLRKAGIKCVKFNPFRPILSGIHNNRDHRKITVIDGKVGFIGGVNLADEYINATSPFGKWKDSAIKLSGEAVKNLTFMFLSAYRLHVKEEENIDGFFPEITEPCGGEGWVQPYGDGPAPFYMHHVGENVYINMINSAQKYLYITTPYLVIDHEMQTALKNAALRGVDVRIITPHIPDKKLVFAVTRSNYKPLMDCGVKIYEYAPGFIHAKNFLADGEAGVVGTINLDYRSLMHHFECAVWMCKTPALESLKEDFEATFTECILQDEKSAKMNVFKRFACNLMQIFTPLL